MNDELCKKRRGQLNKRRTQLSMPSRSCDPSFISESVVYSRPLRDPSFITENLHVGIQVRRFFSLLYSDSSFSQFTLMSLSFFQDPSVIYSKPGPLENPIFNSLLSDNDFCWCIGKLTILPPVLTKKDLLQYIILCLYNP